MSGKISDKERMLHRLSEKDEIIRTLIRMMEGRIEKDQAYINSLKMLVGL